MARHRKSVFTCRARRGPAKLPGVGDRVLLRIEDIEDERRNSSHADVSSRSLIIPSTACSEFSEKSPHGGGRLEPVDKKMLGKELSIPAGATANAEDGDLVAVENIARAASRPPHRPRGGEARLAPERACSQSHRNPCARHSDVFRRETQPKPKRPRPATLARTARTGGTSPLVTIDPPDAKDHDDAVHAEPDTDAEQSRRLHRQRRHRRCRPLRHDPARRSIAKRCTRGNSVYFPDRVVPMLPERISNDLCSLRPREDRPALAVRMVVGADGRKRSHTFHRIMMRSAAKLSYMQAQTAIDGRA